MDTRIIKFFTATIALLYTVYLYTDAYWGSAIFMTIITIVLGLTCLRSMRMIVVFYHLQRQNLDKAKVWLNKINPNHLWKAQKGYYHFLLASTEMQNQSLAQSEKNLRTALQYGLKQDHDKAAVYLNMAVIAANKRRKREAMIHLQEAKKLDTKGYLKRELKEVQKMVNSI